MKHRVSYWVIALVVGIAFYSCTKDFVDKNINNQAIQLMAPGNGISTAIQSQTFWWNQLNGADQYELQIVRGNFNTILQLVVDTVTSNTKYTCTLLPGAYQWRVRGMNGGGNTQYTTYSFTIDSATTMSGQTVVLVSPLNGSYSGKSANTFVWDSIVGATKYVVQIINQSTAVIVVDTTFRGSSLTRSLPNGIYTWQVSAQNASSSSPYSSHTLTIDTTHPSVPTLHSPNNDTILSHETVFYSWSNGTTLYAPIQDSIYIYSNSSMTTIVKDTLTSLTTFKDSLATGTYYWRVRSISATGNKSPYSQLWKFSTP